MNTNTLTSIYREIHERTENKFFGDNLIFGQFFFSPFLVGLFIGDSEAGCGTHVVVGTYYLLD